MTWGRKLAGIAIILFGVYLVYSSLTFVSAEPTPIWYIYLGLIVGVVSIGFGSVLLLSRKRLF